MPHAVELHHIATCTILNDLLKARILLLSVNSQIVWPTLWDDKAKIPRKLKETLREVQDPATRAWNLLSALFYKAGKVPWRLPQQEGEYKATRHWLLPRFVRSTSADQHGADV